MMSLVRQSALDYAAAAAQRRVHRQQKAPDASAQHENGDARERTINSTRLMAVRSTTSAGRMFTVMSSINGCMMNDDWAVFPEEKLD